MRCNQYHALTKGGASGRMRHRAPVRYLIAVVSFPNKEPPFEDVVIKRQRIQFDFSDDQMAQIDRLVDELNQGSRADVLRKAQSLLAMAQRAQSQGHEWLLRSVQGDDERIVLL